MANNRELSEFGGFVSVSNTDKTVGIATTVRITAGGLFVGAVQAIRPDGTWGGSIAGLQGTQGVTGAQGITGSQGITGTQGATGVQGTTGIQGATGSQGTQGATGTQGITGTQGATGTQGTTGAQGVQGITGTGTQGIQGITGSQGIQGSTAGQATSLTTSSGAAPSYSLRAWCNWNGSNGSIRQHGNTSSMAREANGRYTWNFSSAMPNANYALGGGGSYNGANNDGNSVYVSFRRTTPDASTTSVRLQSKGGGDWPDANILTCMLVC